MNFRLEYMTPKSWYPVRPKKIGPYAPLPGKRQIIAVEIIEAARAGLSGGRKHHEADDRLVGILRRR